MLIWSILLEQHVYICERVAEELVNYQRIINQMEQAKVLDM